MALLRSNTVREEHGVRRVIVVASMTLSCLLAGQLGCGSEKQPKYDASLELSSTGLSDGAISKANTCDGQGLSPELSWKSPPEGTHSFALIVTDKDSAFASYVHWVVYNLPAATRELPQGIVKQDQLPDGSRQGRNGFCISWTGFCLFSEIGYIGPCPPGKSPHRYVFDLYALNSKLGLSSGATKQQVLKAMDGHVLAKSELVGRYQH
jgi:Raf kinase inhibitor-like YbhB/YbcL family protein